MITGPVAKAGVGAKFGAGLRYRLRPVSEGRQGRLLTKDSVGLSLARVKGRGWPALEVGFWPRTRQPATDTLCGPQPRTSLTDGGRSCSAEAGVGTDSVIDMDSHYLV